MVGGGESGKDSGGKGNDTVSNAQVYFQVVLRDVSVCVFVVREVSCTCRFDVDNQIIFLNAAHTSCRVVRNISTGLPVIAYYLGCHGHYCFVTYVEFAFNIINN